MEKSITFTLNGQSKTVSTNPARPLLEVLREEFDLTGPKYGCGESECGACTVLVDDVPVRSCVRPVSGIAGKNVTTIESLAHDGKLHPVQEAFLAENAFQCAFCTSGMIMGLVGLLKRKPVPSDDELLAKMEGHICRCCSYANITKAIKRAAASARS